MPRMGPAARSPPRPRRRSGSSLMGGVVDRHSNAPSKQVGVTSVVWRIRRRTYYSRRCKKVPASNIDSLPNEVLSEILVRLSADEIWGKARFVCRNWYHIIHRDAFIDAHVRENSNWGLLLTCLYRDEHPLFLGVRQGRIEVSKLYHKCFSPPIPASCNGLVLSITIPKPYTVNIINLATKQALSLPPSIPAEEMAHSHFSMAYAAASMEYKVVRTYATSRHTFCHVLTVGVDNEWRCVGVDNLSREAKKLLIQDPLITQGFMHWTHKRQGTRVLTLNAETEVFTESYVPLNPHPVDGYGSGGRSIFYLSTGKHLSLLFALRDSVWEVWEMEGESGEWRKVLPNIDLDSHEALDGSTLIKPLGWIKYPVLLAMRVCCVLFETSIVYNLDTDEVEFIELPDPGRHYKAVAHRNTLEWLS